MDELHAAVAIGPEGPVVQYGPFDYDCDVSDETFFWLEPDIISSYNVVDLVWDIEMSRMVGLIER